MKLSRHSNRLAVAAEVGRTPRSNIEHHDRELRRSGASVERRSLPAFFQIAALCRDAATGARFLASLVPNNPQSAIRNPQSALRAFTMVEIAISLAVVGFALVAIIGVLPRGLNAQRDNRTESTVNLDAQYWMDALRSSAQGTNELGDHVRKIEIYDVPNNKVFASYTNGPSTPEAFANDREIIGLLLQTVDRNFLMYADVVALNGSAVEKTGPNSEVGFAYRMYVMIENARDVSPTNAPTDLAYLQGNLYNLRLEFAWPLVGGRVGPHRQIYRSVVQGELLPPEDSNGKPLSFFKR